MSLHGEIVSDDSNLLRVVHDDSGNEVRVLLLEGWYDRVKPLYDYLDDIAAAVGIESAPDHIEACFDWLSTFTVELGAYGWVFSVGMIWWIVRLVKKQINIAKFTYKNRGFGTGSGTGPFGGGFQLLNFLLKVNRLEIPSMSDSFSVADE